jgi:hypothetical protein
MKWPLASWISQWASGFFMPSLCNVQLLCLAQRVRFDVEEPVGAPGNLFSAHGFQHIDTTCLCVAAYRRNSSDSRALRDGIDGIAACKASSQIRSFPMWLACWVSATSWMTDRQMILDSRLFGIHRHHCHNGTLLALLCAIVADVAFRGRKGYEYVPVICRLATCSAD